MNAWGVRRGRVSGEPGDWQGEATSGHAAAEEEVQKQVRETLEKLQGKASKGKGAKYRREKRDQHRQQTEKDLEQQELESKILKVTEFVTVNEVAAMMDVPTTKIISACEKENNDEYKKTKNRNTVHKYFFITTNTKKTLNISQEKPSLVYEKKLQLKIIKIT